MAIFLYPFRHSFLHALISRIRDSFNSPNPESSTFRPIYRPIANDALHARIPTRRSDSCVFRKARQHAITRGSCAFCKKTNQVEESCASHRPWWRRRCVGVVAQIYSRECTRLSIRGEYLRRLSGRTASAMRQEAHDYGAALGSFVPGAACAAAAKMRGSFTGRNLFAGPISKGLSTQVR